MYTMLNSFLIGELTASFVVLSQKDRSHEHCTKYT